MENLKINANKIKKLIDLKTDYWIHVSLTNCYAFALGLDVSYSQISDHAYKLGCFSEEVLKKDNIDVYTLSHEERLRKDLDALEISYCEVLSDYKIEEKDKYNNFLIALFEGHNDFHFLRKDNKNETWYHKRGWSEYPKNKDDLLDVIYNPQKAFFFDYDYVKTYKLSFNRRKSGHHGF